MTQLLTNKNCIIYGAGGGLGSGVAKDFAREGATVFLTGRTQASLERVAGVPETFALADDHNESRRAGGITAAQIEQSSAAGACSAARRGSHRSH